MMMSNTINNGQMPLFIQERSPYEFPDLGTQSWIDQIKIRWAACKFQLLVKYCSGTKRSEIFFNCKRQLLISFPY